MAKTYKPIDIDKTWPAWKREIAERLNTTRQPMKAASLAAGLGETFIRDALKRDKEPGHENLQRIREAIGLAPAAPAPLIGLVVEGKAQAGAFLDISVMDDDYEKPVLYAPRSKKYVEAKQYALQIVGDSMNKIFPEGSYVICANWAQTGLSFKHGMRLHVERHQGQLTEVTVKKLVVEDGNMFLEPESTNAAHKRLELHDDEFSDVLVKGIVVGVYQEMEV